MSRRLVRQLDVPSLTGHWTNRTGVWHTIMGRSMLREKTKSRWEMSFHPIRIRNGDVWESGTWETTIRTVPEDRGFSEVMRHGGGGVGQTP